MAQAIESELPREDDTTPPAAPPSAPAATEHAHQPPADEPPAVEPAAPVAPAGDAFVMSARDDEPPSPPEPTVPEPAPAEDASAWRRARGGGSVPVEPPPAPAWPPRPAAEASAGGDKSLPALVYVLFLAGFLSAGLTSLAGAVIAHVKREEAPDWLRSHYLFQIRTFWIGLAATLLGALTFFFAIGPFIWMAAGLWTAIRCAMGLNWLLKDRPYPNPQTWTV